MARKKKEEKPKSLVQEDVKLKKNEFRDLIGEFLYLKESVEDDRQVWQNRVDRWYRKRYGIRKKKNFPWPSCSNLHLPLVDKTIRKMKPFYVNSILGNSPIVSILDTTGDIILNRAREFFFDWLLLVRMKDYTRNLTLLSDKMLERGFSVAKVTWQKESRMVEEVFDLEEDVPDQFRQMFLMGQDFTAPLLQFIMQKFDLDPSNKEDADRMADVMTQIKSGKKQIIIEKEIDDYNAPLMEVVDPQNIVFPTDTTDIQKSRFIIEKMKTDVGELKRKAMQGIYDQGVVDDIIENLAKNKIGTLNENQSFNDNTINQSTEIREGIYRTPSNSTVVELLDIYFYHEIDGVERKCIMTVWEGNTEKPLRFIKLPYDHNQFPFVLFPFEINADTVHSSRGVPEILDAIATALNIQHNQKIDRQTMESTLVFKFVPSIVNPNNVRFIPSQGIPTSRMDALDTLKIPPGTQTFEREEQILKAWAEEYIGSPDFGLASTLGATGKTPRTAREISEVKQSQNELVSLDARIFMESMRKVFEQIMALWVQYGDDFVAFQITGTPDIMDITKEELMGKYSLVVNNNITFTHFFEMQRALTRVQLLTGNPFVRQDELIRDYLIKDDYRLAQRLLKSQEELAAEQQQQMAMMQAQGGMQGGGRKQPTNLNPQVLTGMSNQPEVKGQ